MITNECDDQFLKEITLINTIFWMDLESIIKLITADMSNITWQRIFIRTSLSHIEAISCKLAEGLYILDSTSRRIQPASLGFKVEKSGGLVWREDKIEKRIMKVVNYWMGIVGSIPMDLQEFENKLRISIRIRHRITHPKTAKDLIVTLAEFRTVAEITRDFKRFIKLTGKGLAETRNKCIKDLIFKLEEVRDKAEITRDFKRSISLALKELEKVRNN